MDTIEYFKKIDHHQEFIKTLEFIYQSLHLNIDYDNFRKVLHENDLLIDSSEMMYSKLINVGAILGVQITKIYIDVDKIFSLQNKNEPWLIFNTQQGKFFGWLGIKEIRGKKAKVQSIAGNFTQWIRLSKLKRILNGKNDDIPQQWLTISSSLPLSSLESRYHKKQLTPQMRLLQFLKIEKNDLFIVIIYSMVAGLLYLVTPIVVQTLVNTIAFGTLLQPFVILTLFLFAVLVFAAIIGTLNSYIVEIIQQRLFVKLSGDLAYRLPRVEFNAFEYHYPPKLVNRFFDIITIQKSASSLVIDGISIILQTIIGMLFLIFYHPMLFVFNSILLLAICFVLFILGRNAIKSSVAESYAKYDMAAWLQDIVRNRIVFKTGTGLNYLTKQADAFACNYIFSRKKHFRILMRQIIGFFAIQALANAFVLGIGGYLVIQGELSLGQLIAAEVIVASIALNLTKMSKHLAVYYDLVAAIDKLGYLLDLPMEKNSGNFVKMDKAVEVKIKDLTFSYPNGKKILENAEIKIPQNSIIGLTGHNGSGKSTFLDILYGLISAKEGTIHYNNIDIRYFFLANLRSHISLSRDIEIFAGTIKDNICLDKKISTAEIEKILENLGILSEILALPKGLDTKLNPMGDPLSQGYCRCLMIARAILSQSKLLIIDQLLDNIDRDLRNHILLYLKRLAQTEAFTIILSGYNQDSLKYCDAVYQISNHKFEKINMRGNHEQLQ